MHPRMEPDKEDYETAPVNEIKAGRFVTIKETAEIHCEERDLRYAQVNGLYGRVKAVWDYNADKFIVEFGGTHGYFTADELDLMTDTAPTSALEAENARLRAALEEIDFLYRRDYTYSESAHLVKRLAGIAADAIKGKSK